MGDALPVSTTGKLEEHLLRDHRVREMRAEFEQPVGFTSQTPDVNKHGAVSDQAHQDQDAGSGRCISFPSS